jgi:hypothetical protein
MSKHQVYLGPFAAMSEAMRASFDDDDLGTQAGPAALQAFPHLACIQAPSAVADIVLEFKSVEFVTFTYPLPALTDRYRNFLLAILASSWNVSNHEGAR